MSKIIKTMDGNEAAAYVAYAFTEVAGIYPITPSSPMAEKTDEWAAAGKKNIFGQPVHLVEMQSEAGAAGVVHGALEAGTLATSYTSSQGLMLMIPTMHRISGQRHPGVLHVAARTVGTHAFSIFGDHSDVMNCRSTGFAMISTGSVQEVMDLAGVAHLAAIESRIPFMHFFDGFRTSHEIQKIECMNYDDLAELMDANALSAWRRNALNPDHPVLRSTVQNPDIYFQVRESNNEDYEALPDLVQSYFDDITRITGRTYKLFQYYGPKDADRVVVAMGSVSGTIAETVDYLNSKGEKVGFIQVHLYRPFSTKHLLKALPKTVTKIAVLDRMKDAGADGEPLYKDICAAFTNRDNVPKIYGGRYGLSSKDTNPAQIKAVFDNLKSARPKDHFTIGIDDDITGHSLIQGENFYAGDPKTISCKFWGLGSDGTVGANKNSIKIISESTDMYTQAYFEYDTKKSFGITKSHLRFGTSPIRSTYLVKSASFIACHNQNFLSKYSIVPELEKGGTFLLNCDWTEEELEQNLPFEVKKYIAKNDIQFYIIDANRVSNELGLGNRANMVLQSAFFNLAKIIPVEQAVEYMKEAAQTTYEKKGKSIVKMNMAAIDSGITAAKRVTVPASWATAKDVKKKTGKDETPLPKFIKNIQIPINAQEGDSLPVSAFVGMKDGTMPLGTSAYEKRGIATDIPMWVKDNCIQCNQCALVCPHGCIRPYLLDSKETKNAPTEFETVAAKGKDLADYRYSLQISTQDCTSCGCCAVTCPAKEKALVIHPAAEVPVNKESWEYGLTLKEKTGSFDPGTIKGSQFKQPLLEFSGACAGCGETPYIKLLTQLYGDKMYFANATGCTQAWGSAMPCVPYTTNKEGKGPAWSNSLFENNAEFSYGMCLAVKQQRDLITGYATALRELSEGKLKAALKKWFETWDDLEASTPASDKLVAALEAELKARTLKGEAKDLAKKILERKDQLSKKTMWMVGGDGWAYDIGYGGLDHVFAMGEDVNVLIVDTEVYSNTGGQSSKATPIGAVAQFQASGKKTKKKDLGLQLMTYGNVYVANVAMGADQNQLIKALKEAQAHKGPSIVVAYAPCINHGIKAGMSNMLIEMKEAVNAGYWFLYRYNPDTKGKDGNPGVFTLDSKEPTVPLREFFKNEVRYASLEKSFPKNAKALFDEAEKDALDRYRQYKAMADK